MPRTIQPLTGSLSDIKRSNNPRVYQTPTGSATKKSKSSHLKRRQDNQAESAALALLAMAAKRQASQARADAAGAFPLDPDALAKARATTGRIRKFRKGRTIMPWIPRTRKLSSIAEGGRRRRRRGRRGRKSMTSKRGRGGGCNCNWKHVRTVRSRRRPRVAKIYQLM
jgi:hypothetical protein